MAEATYRVEDLGKEVVAPSGYYQPLELGFAEHEGSQVLYTTGTACIEASCCGVGSWSYLRVEGYVIDKDPERYEIDTIEREADKAAIRKILLDRHPGARIEFR